MYLHSLFRHAEQFYDVEHITKEDSSSSSSSSSDDEGGVRGETNGHGYQTTTSYTQESHQHTHATSFMS